MGYGRACPSGYNRANADESNHADPAITIKILCQLAVFDPLVIIEGAEKSVIKIVPEEC
jgi:hypothetical protein